jgi:hypothetical protein
MFPLLDTKSALQCAHGMKVEHPPSQVRVKTNGAPVLTVADIGAITGCPFTIPTAKPSPCVTTEWTQGATRVKIDGKAVLLQTSIGVCKSPEQAPQGPPLVTATQMRVKGI